MVGTSTALLFANTRDTPTCRNSEGFYFFLLHPVDAIEGEIPPSFFPRPKILSQNPISKFCDLKLMLAITQVKVDEYD